MRQPHYSQMNFGAFATPFFRFLCRVDDSPSPRWEPDGLRWDNWKLVLCKFRFLLYFLWFLWKQHCLRCGEMICCIFPFECGNSVQEHCHASFRPDSSKSVGAEYANDVRVNVVAVQDSRVREEKKNCSNSDNSSGRGISRWSAREKTHSNDDFPIEFILLPVFSFALDVHTESRLCAYLKWHHRIIAFALRKSFRFMT